MHSAPGRNEDIWADMARVGLALGVMIHTSSQEPHSPDHSHERPKCVPQVCTCILQSNIHITLERISKFTEDAVMAFIISASAHRISHIISGLHALACCNLNFHCYHGRVCCTNESLLIKQLRPCF